MKKKLLALGLTAVMSISLLAGCGGGDSTTTSTTKGSDSGAETTTTAAPEETTSGADGSVYYLNFKPEQDGQWQELAELYTEETGIEVKVITAASGQYETSLMSEMGKSEAPTLFQVNGPVGLANWKDYCYDLSGSKVAGELSDSSFALMDGDSMAGIAYVIETYGIIYNKGLLEKAGYTQDDITNFDSLKTVVEDITARKDELGFAAFTSAGMDGSSDWRFKTHLANLPIYYEYQDEGIGDTEAIKGTYLDNYRMIWDLYINNSTVEPTLLSAKTGDDATAEFVSEQAVFYQNGTWAYGDVADLGDENLGMLPIYIGVEGEEDQGLCTGTENYWCVNKDAAEEDIQATLDFMYWCVSS
ncbi:MAG: ABC transporter substrate-binding protein, partial [Eubacteriales bacterium]|nr:ABC transporter substrate-binding protein [Eubacteriales bacterium]